MSDKILWSSVVIKVPSDFVSVNTNGNIFIKPPLTKKNNIAKSKGQPSIKFITDDKISKVEISEQEEYKENNQPIVIKKIRKSRNKKAVSINDEDYNNNNISNEPVAETTSSKRHPKGSEGARQFMQKLREMRRKKE